MLSYNENAIELLKANPEKINWRCLSANPNAIKLLEENIDKINWYNLSSNPNAIDILMKNKKNIYWGIFCLNENAIEIIKYYNNKIYWDYLLSQNPSIFTYDYDLIRKNFKDLGEEIIQKALHPKRMLRLMEEYGEDEIYKCYFDEE
jgi:hypothetical protein